MALLGLLLGLGPWLGQQALKLVATGLRFDRSAVFEPALLVPRLSLFSLQGLELIVPVAGALALLLGGASLALGGWNFTTQALMPRLDRIDPGAGIKRLLGWRHLLQHLRLIVAAAALLGCAGVYLANHASEIETLARLPLGQALATGFGWLAGGLAVLAAVCFASALIDVPLQIFNHGAELRMTREEARQENRESDGDPHMKGERRRRQRELSRGRMLADVPKASVVITNPTHYAVALQYDEATMGAPRIVAMGSDHLALKIREIAAAARVPMLEAPPLARALYRHGTVGAEVPVELYTAIAQVLAWAWRLRTAVRPPPAPVVEVPPGLDPQETAS
jgi:flagellar biosynthetic protein FlhB